MEITGQEFRQRVMAMKDMMYGAAIRCGLTSDEAADAVQETMIRLWRSRQKIPPAAADLRSYCFAAFRNVMADTLKHRRHDALLDESNDCPAPGAHDAEYADTRLRITQLIASLPPKQAEAIRLSSFADFDNRQIASAICESEANVRQLLSRARRRLRELFVSNFS